MRPSRRKNFRAREASAKISSRRGNPFSGRAAWLLVLVTACDAASSDPGLDAVLEIPGAQYRPGAFPAEDGGPAAIALSTRHPNVVIERVGEKAIGTLEPSARAAVFGIAGYDGAWIVTAGPPDASAPGLPIATALIGVRAGIEPGPFTLQVAAADRDGHFGARAETMLIADEAEPPTGELVIQLVWDGAADLDLHVVDALGGEAWSDKPNTMEPPVPGVPVDPLEFSKHGILDHDGNKTCRRDGRPNESVIWTQAPPAGEYVVRVDTRAMCGAPGAAWYVAAYRNGDLVGAARGVTASDDTLLPHGAGAGVLALRFSL